MHLNALIGVLCSFAIWMCLQYVYYTMLWISNKNLSKVISLWYPSWVLVSIMVKNWATARCWHVSKQSSPLFKVFATINCPRHIRLFRGHPQFSESLQLKLKSTSNGPPAILERTSCSGGITLRSHQQFNIVDFTREPSVTTAEISACNHAASSLLRWRCVIPMRSR